MSKKPSVGVLPQIVMTNVKYQEKAQGSDSTQKCTSTSRGSMATENTFEACQQLEHAKNSAFKIRKPAGNNVPFTDSTGRAALNPSKQIS